MNISVVLLNGSPRKNGNTEICLNRVANKLQSHGVQTSLIHLAGLKIDPCRACFRCRGTAHCAQDDDLNAVLDQLLKADGIVIGSPTWFGSVTGWVKNVIDRAGLVARLNGFLFKGKVGTPVVTVRRGGAVQVYNEIVSFFAINHFYIVGSSYWNFAIGLQPGDVLNDEEGMRTMDDIAENMAYILKALKSYQTNR